MLCDGLKQSHGLQLCAVNIFWSFGAPIHLVLNIEHGVMGYVVHFIISHVVRVCNFISLFWFGFSRLLPEIIEFSVCCHSQMNIVFLSKSKSQMISRYIFFYCYNYLICQVHRNTGDVYCRVVRVVNIESFVPGHCGFNSCKGLLTLSWEEAIQIAYGTSVVLFRCPLLHEIMHEDVFDNLCGTIYQLYNI